MNQIERLTAALLPSTWPTRNVALELARRLDDRHGTNGVEYLLAAWAAWSATGVLPLGDDLAELLLELREVLGGGLGPRCPVGEIA